MGGATQHPAERGGPFDPVDATLTVFALANGMDLVREPSARRLEWYLDEADRGILLAAGPDGGLAVSALAWDREQPQVPPRVRTLEPLPGFPSPRGLTAALALALKAANAL